MDDVLNALHRAIATAANDDTSTKGSETRTRHIQRINAMIEGVTEIERLRSVVRVNGLRWGHSHEEIDAMLVAAMERDGA